MFGNRGRNAVRQRCSDRLLCHQVQLASKNQIISHIALDSQSGALQRHIFMRRALLRPCLNGASDERDCPHMDISPPHSRDSTTGFLTARHSHRKRTARTRHLESADRVICRMKLFRRQPRHLRCCRHDRRSRPRAPRSRRRCCRPTMRAGSRAAQVMCSFPSKITCAKILENLAHMNVLGSNRPES